MSNPDKKRWPLKEASGIAQGLVEYLFRSCSRITVAGSIRRQRPLVGVQATPGEFWGSMKVNLFDAELSELLAAGVLGKRTNIKGSEVWGEKNKLAVHLGSGIPVDLFATSESSWWNYLVCRTGPAESNVRIASEAKRRGMKWNPYGSGFTVYRSVEADAHVVCRSEREVFAAVGLPYLPPERR